MNDFHLDSRLAEDCVLISENNTILLLLMNNALIPWFILVPKTDHTEWYQLDFLLQEKIMRIINILSKKLNDDYHPDKLNIAQIGNIVKQMHLHIVVRYETDVCWPSVVWGLDQKQFYQDSEIKKIKMELNSILEI